MSTEPTFKQMEVLELIKQYTAYNCRCPTYQTVGDLTGRSKQAAWKICQNIMMRGYLRSDQLGKIKLKEPTK